MFADRFFMRASGQEFIASFLLALIATESNNIFGTFSAFSAFSAFSTFSNRE